MTNIAKLSALICVIYLVKELLFPLFKPVSRKQKRIVRRYIVERQSAAAKRKYKNFKNILAKKYVKNLISDLDRGKYKKMIERLDLPITPEEIRTDQIIYVLAAFMGTVVMFSANRLLGCITAIFIVLGWLYPVQEIEKAIEKKNRSISIDFPAFYSMIYYQYSKSVNIFLADVIMDYIPNANVDMAEELGVMLDNIEYGEQFALKQLKKRIPMHYIIKFCDIMETRLRGYDNVSQMTYLKNELDEYRVISLEEELERRERKNARIQITLVIILFVYIIIYYIFTVMESLKLFQ